LFTQPDTIKQGLDMVKDSGKRFSLWACGVGVLFTAHPATPRTALIASTAVAHPHVAAVPALDPKRFVERDGHLVQPLADGGRAELTIDLNLQKIADEALAATGAPYAAAVMVSVHDGRVLALAGRSSNEGRSIDVATHAWAPAASVFKLVTAAALVEHGVAPDERVCYHGGVHSVEPDNLKSVRRWDTSCQSLSWAVAKSQNAIIARLAHDHLPPVELERTAHALGFGERLPFDLPVEASSVSLPRGDSLDYARAAAGFWHTTLSPLHGAALAAAIARGGMAAPLHLVEKVVDASGTASHPLRPTHARRELPEAVAQAVAKMMVGTTTFGTARLGFHDKRGRTILPVPVAGKTGTLNRRGNCSGRVGCGGDFLAYSWFVGFAPANEPEVAFAVLLGNSSDWRKKAHQVAAEILRAKFETNRTVASN
jgi:cell division protein FtsI/penicillin-binding protein 2